MKTKTKTKKAAPAKAGSAKSKLSDIKTLGNYLDHLEENYDTDNCKPGKIAKTALVSAISNMATDTPPRVIELCKMKAYKAESISEFIDVIRENFDPEKKIQDLNKLEKNHNALCTLVSLKKI